MALPAGYIKARAERPYNKGMKNIHLVAKAVLFNDGEVLLLRRSNTDSRRPLQWDLPGGYVEDGEEIKEGCAREVDEEAGIKVTDKDLHLAHALTEIVDGKSVTWLIFIGRTDAKEIKLSYEHDKYEWVSLDKAIEMMEYPRHLKALKHIKEANLVT